MNLISAVRQASLGQVVYVIGHDRAAVLHNGRLAYLPDMSPVPIDPLHTFAKWRAVPGRYREHCYYDGICAGCGSIFCCSIHIMYQPEDFIVPEGWYCVSQCPINPSSFNDPNGLPVWGKRARIVSYRDGRAIRMERATYDPTPVETPVYRDDYVRFYELGMDARRRAERAIIDEINQAVIPGCFVAGPTIRTTTPTIPSTPTSLVDSCSSPAVDIEVSE